MATPEQILQAAENYRAAYRRMQQVEASVSDAAREASGSRDRHERGLAALAAARVELAQREIDLRQLFP